MAIDAGFSSYSLIKISKPKKRQIPDMVFLKFYADWALQMPLNAVEVLSILVIDRRALAFLLPDVMIS